MKYLYHFSENGKILQFTPRRVKVPAKRAEGMEWLNGKLVWAIDSPHSPLYLFPRECPRIIIWRQPQSKAKDVAAYWHDPSKHMVAYFEENWLERIQSTHLFRYALPSKSFVDLKDAGMHVSDQTVNPVNVQPVGNLLTALKDAGVEIRPIADLGGLKPAWNTSLHVSGIRLRNAQNW